MRHIVVACVLLSFATIATAEPRRTTETVKLRKKPGEKEAVVTTLPPNTEVTVIEEQGRWLKVRARGEEGFLTRTTVTNPDAHPSPEEGKWSASRHPAQGGSEVTALFVQVTAPSSLLRAAPAPSAAKVADVAPGAHLTVIDAASMPGWIHARDDQGHDGWIARAEIDNGASAVTVTGVDLKGTAAPTDHFTRPAPHAFEVTGGLGIGYRSLGMDLSSNAEGGLTNYLVDADALAAGFDVDVAKRLPGRLFVAGDVRVETSLSSPGIDYPGPTAPAGKIPFKTFATDAGVRVGLRLKDTFELALRAGGHYDAFLPDSVDNAGMLPRERLLGVTLGARADIAPAHSRFGASLRFDALVIGSRAQTPGLEDGTSSTAHAFWGGLAVRYLVSAHLAPFASYDFGRATTRWSGMSVREPGVTNASRVDSTQLVQLGISAEI